MQDIKDRVERFHLDQAKRLSDERLELRRQWAEKPTGRIWDRLRAIEARIELIARSLGYFPTNEVVP